MKPYHKVYFLIFMGTFLYSCKSSIRGADNSFKQDSAHAEYVNYCSGCHGSNLEKFEAAEWNGDVATARMFSAIKYGVDAEGMPSYDTTFTDAQITKLVSYLKKRKLMASAESKKQKEWTLYFSTNDYEVAAVRIANNLEIPWAMQMLPDGDILFTEKNGSLSKLLPDGKIESIMGVPKVRNRGQGGLLDIKLHPNFLENSILYLSYSKPSKKDGEDLGTTAVIKARLAGTVLEDVQEVFEALPYVSASHHYAGRLQFDNQGYLFISVGDRGSENQHPQFLTNSCGKIHRINDDGTIPVDNPFANDKNAVQSIYSYGHRNPQGLALRSDGTLWENEHGPKGGDEINIISSGKNYGWPLVTFGVNYNGTTITKNTSLPDMVDPIKHWTPSIAPSSLCFVYGKTYPKWNGNLLSASLKFDYIARTVLQGDKVVKEEKILEGIGRIRNVVELSDGKIYVTVENPGRIYRLEIKEK